MNTGPGLDGAHEIGPQRADHVTAENARDAHHHARIDPVIEMGAPADDELRKPGVPPGLFMIQKGLFRKVVRTAGAGIQLRHLRIADRGCQAQQKGDDDAHPHGRRVEPSVAWGTKVSHRKAPGAISAIAFIVNPVRPRVACISGAFVIGHGETSLFLVWAATEAGMGSDGACVTG